MEVEIDQAAISDIKAALGDLKDKYKSVLTTSINKTLATAKVQTKARIGNELNLTAARIDQDLTIQKANFSKLSGALIAKGEPVGLAQFSPVDGPTGVKVKVLRSSSPTLLKHAYLAPGKSGSGLHVWWRGKRENMPAAKKFPTGVKSRTNWYKIGNDYRGIGGIGAKHAIERRTGPRIEDIFAKPQVFDPINIQAHHIYLQNVDAKIAEILRRWG